MGVLNHIVFILSLLVAVSLSLMSDSMAQIRTKLSNLRVELGTGYDTNLFRVADQSDSNRVEAPTETVDGQLFWWVYWNRNVKSYFFISGSYSYYINKTFANEWKWKAKSKTSLAIKRRPSHFIPRIRLNITFGIERRNQIYTDRAWGAENFRDLNNDEIDQISLGDLFDRISYFFGGGLNFKFGRKSSLSLDYYREDNDHTDISDPLTQDFYSLDNVENNVGVRFIFKPVKSFKIKLSYNGQDRQYDYKLARDMNGKAIPNKKRRYWTNTYRLDLYWNDKNVKANVGTTWKLRNDRFKGYYNYEQMQINGELSFNVFRNSFLIFDWRRTWKEYDHLELANKILHNCYLTLEAGLRILLARNVVFHTSFVHDRETSTYEKFTYRRNIVMGRFEYRLD